MSHATILEHIKADLDRVDADSLLSIREIIDISLRKVSRFSQKAKTPRVQRLKSKKRALKFIGENLLPREYEGLSMRTRGELQWRLKELNAGWLKKQFAKLNAAWVVIVDGEVFAAGETLENKPLGPQILEVCKATGKFPFLFVNDKFITIEESRAAWQPTIRNRDFYPTLPIKIGGNSEALEVVGDFDSGSSHTFVDYDFFESQNIVHPELRDYPEVHVHLNQPFLYIDKVMRIALPDGSGDGSAVDVRISCVQNWRASPFVEINPKRVALIGRDILLKLKPKVLLDFDQLQTEIMTSGKARQTRKSTRKERTPRRRR